MALQRSSSLSPLLRLLRQSPRKSANGASLLPRCCAYSATTDAAAKPRSTSPRSVHHQRREFGKLEAALRAFQRIHGHYAVPLRFTAPGLKEEGEQQVNVWPEELRGMKLGTALSRFVKVADKPENAAIASKLEDMGVPVRSISDWKTYLWTNVSVASLQTFYTIHGHFLVPYAFTVPHGDAAWPRQTWGFKLGYWVIELRRDKSKLEAYQLQDLVAMKFVWNAREARWNQYFVPAMKKYTELYGKSSVPQSFVVPHDDVRWPKKLHGYRLGQKVNNLRCGEQSASALDETVAWDDVELVYSNWVLLDILHDDTKENGSRSSDASDKDA